MTTQLRPDPDALALAEKMVMAEHTMWQILDETVTSAEEGEVLESGRTVCGAITTAKNPVRRFPKSVDLESCPRGVSGTWHSHVRRSELLSPEHSLPDMANVVFGAVDSSVVVGARESDVLMAAEDRGEMQRSFRNVLGLDVHSTADVVDAMESDEISDYVNARARLRREFSTLFRTVDMPFGTMEGRIAEVADVGKISPHAPDTAGTHLEPMYRDYTHGGYSDRGGEQFHTQKVRDRFQQSRDGLADVSDVVAESAVGSVVGMATQRIMQSMFSS